MEERLARIEADQARILAVLEHLSEKMENRISQTDAWRERVGRTLYGDGNGTKGHSIRLDRLEQAAIAAREAHSRQKKLLGTVAAAVVVMALKAVWGLLTAGSPA